MIARVTLMILLATLGATRIRLKDKEDALVRASGVLKDVLKTSHEPHCSVVLVMDGTVSYHAVFKIVSDVLSTYACVLIDVPFSQMGANKTRSHLNATLQGTRMLRQATFCVTFVVVSYDTKFLSLLAEISTQVRLLASSSKLLLVTDLSYTKLRNLLSSYTAFSRMNAIVITGKERYDLYSNMPYTPTGSQVVKLASWTSNEGLSFTENYRIFPEKYKNFYGAQQLVAALMVEPFWIFKTIKTSNGQSKVEVYGREYLVLDAIGKSLNFTFKPIPISKSDEMFTFLVTDKSAFASVMRIAMLPIFQERGEFLVPLERASFTFVMAKPTLKPQWQSLYYPLTDYVWAFTLLLFLMMPLIFKMVKFTDVQERMFGTRNGPVVLQTIGILLGQGEMSAFPRSSSTRLLLLTWLIFSFILGTAYRGNLTAFLTVRKYPERIETLEQLALSSAKCEFRPHASSFYEFFRDSEIPAHQAVYRKTTYVETVTKGLQDAMENNVAYFHERLSVGMYIARQFTSADGQSKLYIAKENVLPGYAAWWVPHNAPYKDNLNRILQIIIEAGLIEKWTDDVMFKERRAIYQNRQLNQANWDIADTSPSDIAEGSVLFALTIVHLQGPLYLLLIGIGIASFTFLTEIVVKSYFKV